MTGRRFSLRLLDAIRQRQAVLLTLIVSHRTDSAHP